MHVSCSEIESFVNSTVICRHQPIMLIFSPIMLCCSAQNFDLLCSILCSCMLKFDCSIRVCSKIINVMTVLLEYIKFYNANNNCGECSIRVYRSLLIF